MNDRKPLILFSGGADSTLLLHKAGYNAEVLYVDVMNNAVKSKRERAAIDKIRHEGDFYLTRLHVKELGGVKVYPTGHRQMTFWFTALFEYADERVHSECQIGYLGTDCCGDSIPAMVEAWDALWKACRPVSYDQRPRLVFPLMHHTKAEVLAELPDNLHRLTTTCESDVELEDGEPCGFCKPCRARFSALLDIGRQDLLSDKELEQGFSRSGYADAVKRLQLLKMSPDAVARDILSVQTMDTRVIKDLQVAMEKAEANVKD